MNAAVFQDRATGKRVRRIGATSAGEDDYVLVKGQDGTPYYAQMANLMPVDSEGRPDFDARYERPELPEEQLPEPVVDLVETRLNINAAPAEEIARRVSGIGYRVAKKIKELQLTQPGERFRNLEQLKGASNRVNWEAVFRENTIYVG